ncbi:MAG: relaxase domain-containing protein [Egibacteraceae bacterium]
MDGKWRALDGRALLSARTGAGALYNRTLEAELTRRLGVAWRDRPDGLRELDGVDEKLIETFSSRRRAITPPLNSSPRRTATSTGWTRRRRSCRRGADRLGQDPATQARPRPRRGAGAVGRPPPAATAASSPASPRRCSPEQRRLPPPMIRAGALSWISCLHGSIRKPGCSMSPPSGPVAHPSATSSRPRSSSTTSAATRRTRSASCWARSGG